MTQPLPEYALDAAVLTDRGTQRPHNEDHAGLLSADGGAGVGVLVVVADGVSGNAAGATASQTAVEAVLRAYRELDPLPPGKRLPRAVQQANIAVHDLALMVPELRGMATTLTAFVVHRAELTVAHVGDCRLYIVRQGSITQLTKDHTVTGERVRMRLMSSLRARHHPDRSVLTRSLGRELIVAVDRITTTLRHDDVVVCCSDGLYNVLPEEHIATVAGASHAAGVCCALVDAANRQGTDDNLTVAVVRAVGPIPDSVARPGVAARLLRRMGRRS